ncbi:MAG: hypothetical protein Q9222_000053 [Ikaeria aurantiellina]
MSPRRSSRSKTSQPTSATQHTNSSSSSVSSSRVDRRSRSNNKLPSPRSSIPPRSSSSDDRETSGNPQARRTRRGQDAAKNERDPGPDDEELDEQDLEEEDEITRCVCGQQEYPGLSTIVNDPTKLALKNSSDPSDAASSVTVQEDAGGMFIQCDICKVWQHGGCVGIMDEDMSREEYFCEQCRKDLHTISISATGQKRSIYLPVQEPSSPQPSPSPGPLEEHSNKPKEGRSSRLNAESIAGKRRSTMNSRDAAYDEAEQLRRAIEESKKEGGPGTNTSPRKGKRSREDSDQPKESSKRQRTKSGSSTTSSNEKSITKQEEDDEEETAETNTAIPSAAKSVRGAAARNHRNKEFREREEKREKDRADAAGRRKGRAERRRGDESDPSDEPVSRTTSSKAAEQTHAANPSAPSQNPASVKASHHKKTGRPPARRGRIGRNQHTRDRDHNSRLEAPKQHNITGDATSPAHSNHSKEGENGSSRSANAAHNNNNLQHHHHHHRNWSTELGKPSKPRYMNPNRTTMNEMKRRVAGILEFVSLTRVEMGAAAAEVPASSDIKSSAAQVSVTPPDRNDEQRPENDTTGNRESPIGTTNGEGSEVKRALDSVIQDLEIDRFRKLGSAEMTEVLMKGLIKWQGEFGK